MNHRFIRIDECVVKSGPTPIANTDQRQVIVTGDTLNILSAYEYRDLEIARGIRCGFCISTAKAARIPCFLFHLSLS